MATCGQRGDDQNAGAAHCKWIGVRGETQVSLSASVQLHAERAQDEDDAARTALGTKGRRRTTVPSPPRHCMIGPLLLLIWRPGCSRSVGGRPQGDGCRNGRILFAVGSRCFAGRMCAAPHAFANEDLAPASRGQDAAEEREMQSRFPTVPSQRRGREAAGSEMRSRSRLTGWKQVFLRHVSFQRTLIRAQGALARIYRHLALPGTASYRNASRALPAIVDPFEECIVIESPLLQHR